MRAHQLRDVFGVHAADNYESDRTKVVFEISSHVARLGPPYSTSRAMTDAVAIAMTAWLNALLTIIWCVVVIRLRLRRMRDTQWERDINCLVGNEGGHSNTSP